MCDWLDWKLFLFLQLWILCLLHDTVLPCQLWSTSRANILPLISLQGFPVSDAMQTSSHTIPLLNSLPEQMPSPLPNILLHCDLQWAESIPKVLEVYSTH